MFLEHAKLLKKNKRLQESLQVLTANKLNIEEARKHECFVEQARILENRNDLKLYNLQVKGQYSEKQLKESFLGKKFHLWLCEIFGVPGITVYASLFVNQNKA